MTLPVDERVVRDVGDADFERLVLARSEVRTVIVELHRRGEAGASLAHHDRLLGDGGISGWRVEVGANPRAAATFATVNTPAFYALTRRRVLDRLLAPADDDRLAAWLARCLDRPEPPVPAATTADLLSRSLAAALLPPAPAPAAAPATVVAGSEAAVIAVAGADGGVGRTTVAALLAASLAERGPGPVVAVDAGVELGDLDLLLVGAAAPPRARVAAALAVDPAAPAGAPGPAGVQVIGGPSATSLGPEPALPPGLIERLRSRGGAVVVDCGAGLGGQAGPVLAGADAIILVTDERLDPVAATLAALPRLPPSVPRLVLLNRAGGRRSRRSAERLRSALDGRTAVVALPEVAGSLMGGGRAPKAAGEALRALRSELSAMLDRPFS